MKTRLVTAAGAATVAALMLGATAAGATGLSHGDKGDHKIELPSVEHVIEKKVEKIDKVKEKLKELKEKHKKLHTEVTKPVAVKATPTFTG